MMEALHHLSERDLQDIALALRTGRISVPVSPLSVQRIVPGEHGLKIARDLQAFAHRGFGVEQIVTTLELLRTDRLHRTQIADWIDLVTTGPDEHIAGNRDTGVVVRDLFAGANESVLVAGYAVYQGQRVFQALADRMRNVPDLKVRLFLDIQRGRTDSTASDQLIRRFAYRFKDSEWPKDRPLPEVYFDPRSLQIEEHRTSLHAKCIVVDRRRLFVSSANFTEAAQLRNIEVGVTVSEETIAERLTEFFEAMVTAGHLVRVPIG
jgi:phosphatidylserine/phosphatidylglycerophosphate/cardiolipin synthase-like enzyme